MSEDKKSKVTELLNKYLPEPAKEALKKLAAEFASDPNTPPADNTQYSEVPLKDGSTLKVAGDGSVGSECILVTADGEMPAPEGEIMAADGTIIVVKKEGDKSVIAEVKPAEQMKDEKMSAALKEIEERIEGKYATKLAAIESNYKNLKAELEATKLKLSKTTSQVGETIKVVKAFSEIPTEEPIQKPNQKTEETSSDRILKNLFPKK